MTSYKNKLFGNNEFLRNIFTLFSGSLAAQAIPFLATILLTRLYPEEALGTFFVFGSTVAVLSIISTLQYELSIVLPQDDKDSANLFVLSICLATIISILILAGVFFFHDSIVGMLADDGMEFWLWMVPLSVWLTGIFQAYTYWCNRFRRYPLISWAKISRAGSMSGMQIGSGYLPAVGTGLIGGQIIGLAIGNIHFLLVSLKQTRPLLKQVSWKGIVSTGMKYKDIPMFNTLIQGLNTLSNQLPIFLLTRFFGTGTSGHYGLSNRIISTPMGLVGQSVGQVFFQRASEIYNQGGDLRPFVSKTYIGLIKVAILPFLIVLFLAPEIFGFFFGSGWETAGTMTQILVPWLFVMFLNSPLTFIITILNKQKQMLLYDSLLIIFRFAALAAGYFIFDHVLACVALYSAVGLIFNIWLMTYLIRISGNAK